MRIPEAWPHRLRRPQAAAFAAVSVGIFDRMVARGDVRPPVYDVGIPFWYKADLEADLDALKGGAPGLPRSPFVAALEVQARRETEGETR